MTLRSLRIFITVVQTGTMSAAANTLYVAQPTVSQTIIELEKEYNIKLFDRLNKKLFLTQEGEAFYKYAFQILTLTDEMEENLRNMTRMKKIYLGATLTAGKCILVDMVQQFEGEYPEIQVHVRIDNTAAIEKLLLESRVDIGFVEGRIKSTELLSVPVLLDELVLACSHQHAFAERAYVTPDELPEHPFVLREEGSGTRDIFEGILHKHNLTVETKWNCRNFDSIIDATIANQGITVISRRLIEEPVRQGQLHIVPLRGVDLNRTFSIVYHKTKYLHEALQKWIAFVQSYEQKEKAGETR